MLGLKNVCQSRRTIRRVTLALSINLLVFIFIVAFNTINKWRVFNKIIKKQVQGEWKNYYNIQVKRLNCKIVWYINLKYEKSLQTLPEMANAHSICPKDV